MIDKQVKECVQYFKMNQNGFDRLLKAMLKKWQSLGKVGGKVTLENVTEFEREALNKYFHTKQFTAHTATISLLAFQKELVHTKFNGLSLEDILSAYFHTPLISNAQVKQEKKRKLEEIHQSFIQEIQLKYAHLNCSWIEDMSDVSFKKLCSDFDTMEDVSTILHNCYKGLEMVESVHQIRLSVLSMECFQNPHALDWNEAIGKLFFRMLLYVYQQKEKKDEIKLNNLSAEDRLEIYLYFHIRLDDISSFTCLKGFHLYTKDGLHPAYEGFLEMDESYLVSLSQLANIIKIEPIQKSVFVVENQMVYSHISSLCPHAALVCTSGQAKIASLLVLDLLSQQDCIIYYSGDIDPEGLRIANRLISRYKEKVIPWHMGMDDYMHSLSNKVLSEQRLSELDGLTNPILMETARVVKVKKVAGYQEKLMDAMILDIQNKNVGK